jgi:DnaK suppressor protein
MLVKIKNGKADDKSAKNGKSVEPMERLYRPSDKEPFMNERQREYFRLKLLDWREDILKEAKETLQHLQDDNQNHPDLADRASSETDRAIELRARDRQRKLISKIDAALQRIEDGTYGYCEETGEPISLKRLEARPIATLAAWIVLATLMRPGFVDSSFTSSKKARGSRAPKGASNHDPRGTGACCHVQVLRARKRALSGRARLPALYLRLSPGL